MMMKLKEESYLLFKNRIRVRNWHIEGDNNVMWNEPGIIRRIVEEILG